MLPELFGLPLHPLLLAAAIGSGVALSVGAARRGALAGLSPRLIALLTLWLGLCGLMGAKLDAWIEQGMVQSLGSGWRLGFRYPGGVLGALVGAWLAVRLGVPAARMARVGDALAPVAGVAMALTRLGCFLAGCCHGVVSSVPWAVRFPAGSYAWQAHVNHALIPADATVSLAVHPLQLYFAAASLALAALAWRMLAPWRPAGQVLFTYLLLDNLAKAGLETLRDPLVPHLATSSLLLAAAAALGVAWTLRPLPAARALAGARLRRGGA